DPHRPHHGGRCRASPAPPRRPARSRRGRVRLRRAPATRWNPTVCRSPQHEDARDLRGLQRAPHGVRQHAHRHSPGAPVRQRAVDRAGVPPRPKAHGCDGRRRRGRHLCIAHPQRDRAGLGRQCRALRRSPRAECAGAARLGTRAWPRDTTAPCRPAPRPRRAGQAARCLLSRLRAARARAGAPVASSRGAARRGDDAGRGARRRDGRARPSPHVLVLDRAVRVRVCIGAPAVRRRARPHEPPRGTARAHVATLGPRRRRWRRAVRGRASAPVARLPAAVRADVRPGHRCRLLLPAALLRAGRACNRAPRRRPGVRIAVLGPRPDICFYRGRRAATGYLHTYPLMEAQPYAARMQREMVGQIERARPAFLVYVNVPASWLIKENSDPFVLTWFEAYQRRYYERVGVVDILSPGFTLYLWDAAAAGYTPRSNVWLAVFKLRDASALHQ